MITEHTTKTELLQIWNDNINDLVDAFIAANIDPDAEETTADQIRDVICQWIADGDECAA